MHQHQITNVSVLFVNCPLSSKLVISKEILKFCVYLFLYIYKHAVFKIHQNTPTFICIIAMSTRYHSRFFDCLANPNLKAALATDQK